MSLSSLVLPPQLSNGGSYETFKKELDIWKLLKSCSDEEQGPIVFRTLSGKAKSAALELTAAEIGATDGLSKILLKLDALYLPEDNQRICAILEKFESMKRSPSMTMSSFIIEFERLHNQLKDYGCTYPDGVLAFRLMKSSSMSKEHEQLCRATVETDKWSYKGVKNQIKKIFNDYVALKPDSNISIEQDSPLPIKIENTYLAKDGLAEANTPISYEEGNAIHYENYTNEEYDWNNIPEYSWPQDEYREPEPYDVYYGPSRSDQGSWKWNTGKSGYRNPRGRFNPGGWRSGPTPHKFQKPNGYQVMNEAAGSNSNNPGKQNPFAMNPRDYRGNPTVCRKCRSMYHWWENCPHVTPQEKMNASKQKVYYNNQNNVQEDLYIALFQKSAPTTSDEIICLMGETLNMGVIDSGCTKTCCGKTWLDNYLETLSKEEVEAIQTKETSAVFRFGDSDPVNATHTVLLPLKVHNVNFMLETEVVPSDVPLLLSKETMKRGKAKINFVDDKIELFGQKLDMTCTSSGHYAIPIAKSNPSSIVLLADLETKDQNGVANAAKKLHTQFCHPSAKRLIKYVESSGQEDADLKQAIQVVSDKCDVCKIYKKPSPKPVVSFPMASEFNETIAMDLKIYKNNSIYILHIIDHLTRFSAGAVIRSKKGSVIIEAFFKSWIAVFGPPRKVLSDNGGEFANEEFLDLCQNLNINFQTTAAESPWSNGLVERHNAIIGEAVAKIVEDVHCSVDVAVCWAVHAKNSLQNIHGFSSYQLVFGRNPVLPSVLDNKLPALEGVSGSKLIADNLNAQHQARLELVKLEASEKLRRALRAQTRTYSNKRYLCGEEVFYKRDEDKKWRGPGRVIGQDGSKILIKIPTGLITVHSCRVILTSDAEQQRLGIKEIQVDNATDSDTQTEVHEQPVNTSQHVIEDTIINGMLTRSRSNLQANNVDVGEQVDENQGSNTEDLEEEQDSQLNNEIQQEVLDENALHNEIKRTEDLLHTKDLPPKNQIVSYRENESNDWKKCKILGRGGKATGPNKYYLNVKYLDDDKEKCVNWKDDVEEWKIIGENVLTVSTKDAEYIDAKEKELLNWKNLNVYEEVEDEGQDYVSVKWVLTEKEVDSISIKKARLVAKGFQENHEDLQTDSPTANKETVRIVLAVIPSLGWDPNLLDVCAAFLQGKDLDREIYLKPPKEGKCTGKLWRLNKCVYGLEDASRFWYFRVKEELIRLGCKMSKYDSSLFVYHDHNGLQGLLILHVDDCLWAGSDKFKISVIMKLREVFKISKEDVGVFKYLGTEIQQSEMGICVSQRKYLEKLQEIEIKPDRRAVKETPVSESEREELRSVIGKLNWLATQTRPDLSYDVCELSTSQKNATVELLMKTNKVIKKAKYNDVFLQFPELDVNNLTIRCYADASYGNLCDGGSQGGVYIEAVSGSKSAPLEWQSKRLRRTPKSTLAAETIAMVEAMESAILVSRVLSEIIHNGTKAIPIEALTDCYSLFEAAQSTTSIQDRRLRIELSILREGLSRDEFKLKWVKTGCQLADCFTKKGSDPRSLVSRITGKEVY